MTARSALPPTAGHWPSVAVSPFDRLVIAVVGAMVALTALVILRGDRVGVRLMQTAPVEQARRTSAVTLRFSEDMNRESVAGRFRLEPAVAGDVSWSGRTMRFKPRAPLDAAGRYTVVLAAGAESEAGRKLLTEQRFAFTVLGQRLAYLAPIDGPVKNVWMADPAGGAPAQQVTRSRLGVVAFDVSPDGGQLAFAESSSAGGSDLRLLDLDTGDVRSLTSCADNLCTNPIWSPDGSQIAFERRGTTPSAIPGVPRDTTRVWVIGPAENPPRARLLLPDPQVPAHFEPRWSPDGARIAVSEPIVASGAGGGILVHTLATGEDAQYRASATGVFSPDGAQLSFPALVARDGEVRTTLQSVPLDGGSPGSPGPAGMTVDVGELAWRPGTDTLTVTRRAVGDERSLGRQLYTVRAGQAEPAPLLVEPAYDHAYFTWDPNGRFLAVERAVVQGGAPTGPARDPRSQIWLYDVESGQLSRVATNAFQPRWVP